jgi:pyruvate,water dikinase
MAATASPAAAFPSPFKIETPPGCEGWEEMYPYYALYAEPRRELDEQRLWFWNSQHFPVPMPAFDVVAVDGPYQAVGAWQNRTFAVPPAMGLDYRIVNGYVYISANYVTDPAKMAERAGFFEKRAGHYFSNWESLYGEWRGKMEALLAEITALEVPDLPEYESDDVAFGDQGISHVRLLEAYDRTLRCADEMWEHHFEFLLLGYGAYATFSDFCKSQLPDIPDQHVAQMVAGIDVILFRADAELRRLARLAIETGVDGAFVEGRTPDEIDADLATSESGRSWLEALEAIKDPWFNMGTGDGLYHYYGSWYDDPTIPYASLIGHVAALHAGREIDRPTEEIERERDRLADEYSSLMEPAAAQTFRELLGLSRTVFPYVEEHKFWCDYWFQARFFNKVREFGALLARHGFLEDGEDIFQLSRHEVGTALDELSLSWATGGVPLGPAHWPPIAARRKELLARLADWTPPPALGTMPETVSDPMTVMLWGVTPARLQEWARAADDVDSRELHGAPASPGVVEGRARVMSGVGDLSQVREGEILVCTITSPAWAPIFSKIRAAVTDIGGVMSHAAIVCREYGMPAVVGTGRATATIKTGQLLRVDGVTGTVTILDDGPQS